MMEQVDLVEAVVVQVVFVNDSLSAGYIIAAGGGGGGGGGSLNRAGNNGSNGES